MHVFAAVIALQAAVLGVGESLQHWRARQIELPAIRVCCKPNAEIYVGTMLGKGVVLCEPILPRLMPGNAPEPLNWRYHGCRPLNCDNPFVFARPEISADSPWYVRDGMKLTDQANLLRAPNLLDEVASCAVAVPHDPDATIEALLSKNCQFVDLLDAPEYAKHRKLRDFNRRLTQPINIVTPAQRHLDYDESVSLNGNLKPPATIAAYSVDWKDQQVLNKICAAFNQRQQAGLANRMTTTESKASTSEPVFDRFHWYFKSPVKMDLVNNAAATFYEGKVEPKQANGDLWHYVQHAVQKAKTEPRISISGVGIYR